MVAGQWLEQVVRLGGIFRCAALLAFVAGPPEIKIEQAGRDLVPEDRLHDRTADQDFAAFLVRRPMDRAGRDFRLEDGRDRLRFARQAALRPIELRRVQRR